MSSLSKSSMFFGAEIETQESKENKIQKIIQCVLF